MLLSAFVLEMIYSMWKRHETLLTLQNISREKKIYYNIYDEQLISLLMAKVTSQTNVFQWCCMKKKNQVRCVLPKLNIIKKENWKKGNVCNWTDKKGGLDEALSKAKFSIRLMRNFCEFLYACLFCEPQ